jgi:hypothetical protein
MPMHPPRQDRHPSCNTLSRLADESSRPRIAVYRMAATVPLYARPKSSEESNAPWAPLGRRWSDRATAWIAQQTVPRAGRWPHRQAVMLALAECRVCRPQQHGSPSERRRGPQDVRMPTVSLAALSASAFPASVRPMSSVRWVSSVRPSGVQRPISTHAMSTIRFPRSGCGRPVPRVGVHAFRVRVRRVCTRDFVECVGARTTTRPRRGQVWPSCCIRGRLDHLPEPTGLWSGVSGIASGA